jgi:hypothetical protein
MDHRRDRRTRHIHEQALMYRKKAGTAHDVDVRDEYEALATLLEQTEKKLRKVTTIKKEIQVARNFERLVGEMLARIRAKHEKPH